MMPGHTVISEHAEACFTHVNVKPAMSFCSADPNESREPRCLSGGTAQPDAYEHRPGRAGRAGAGGAGLSCLSCGCSPPTTMARTDLALTLQPTASEADFCCSQCGVNCYDPITVTTTEALQDVGTCVGSSAESAMPRRLVWWSGATTTRWSGLLGWLCWRPHWSS